MTNAVSKQEAHRLPSHSNVIYKTHVIWRAGKTRLNVSGGREANNAHAYKCRGSSAHRGKQRGIHQHLNTYKVLYPRIRTFAKTCIHRHNWHNPTLAVIRWKHSQTTSIWDHSRQVEENSCLFLFWLKPSSPTANNFLHCITYTHHNTLWWVLFFFNGLVGRFVRFKSILSSRLHS